ncbi:MAG: T9SS C-terminal target domain-containing protein [Calditrichaeota bacterium]|nr:MAG: T9SS C-terminal target domain-containing protein [Calditrichota bacterium]
MPLKFGQLVTSFRLLYLILILTSVTQLDAIQSDFLILQDSVALEAPVPNFPPGIYAEPFTLRFSHQRSNTLFYFTSDGSTPSPAQNLSLNDSLIISKTTILNIIATDSSGLTSQPVAYSYIFENDFLRQKNEQPDLPALWSGLTADYEMDPEVIETYGEELPNALRALPIISLTMDRDSLWGTEGIYQNSEESGREWERPASVEFIQSNENSGQGFQINAGIRIHGGTSRNPENSPKHSFRLYFRGSYGAKKLNYPLFDKPEAAHKFDQLILRAGYNNSWLHPNGVWDMDQRKRGIYSRDQWMRDTQRLMGHISPHGFHVHLFLNGLYWGIYNLVERPNADFAASYFGGQPENYDALNSGEVVDGDGLAWQELLDVAAKMATDPTGWDKIQSRLHVAGFIDYILLNQFAGNIDWDMHNWYAIRKREPAGKFHFVSWDAEHCFANLDENILSTNNPNSPTFIFHKLLEIAEFRFQLSDRLFQLTKPGGLLHGIENTRRFDILTQSMESAILAESARWGDYRRDVHRTFPPFELYTRDSHWAKEREFLCGQFFPQRTEIFLRHYQEAGWFSMLAPPYFSHAGGILQQEINIFIQNPNEQAGTIYYTNNGSDPRTPKGEISAHANTGGNVIKLPINKNLHIKSRIYDSVNRNWSPANEVEFTFYADISGLQITELMYNPLPEDTVDGDNFEFIELQNTGPYSLDLSGIQFTDGIDFIFADGVELAADSFIVLASNKFYFQQRYGFAPFKEYTKNLSNKGEKISLENKSGQMLISFEYDDKAPWPQAADGEGYSLIYDARLDSNATYAATAWRLSTMIHGSPGLEEQSAASAIAADLERLPQSLQLWQNYPNPFNAGTRIDYFLPEPADIDFKIYNALGQTLYKTAFEKMKKGRHTMYWPGTNNHGMAVSSGVYIYQITAREKNQTSSKSKKLILMK